MGFVTIDDASGQGTLDLGGVQFVTEVAWQTLTVADLANVAGATPVRRLHHQAWWALTFTPDSGPTTGIPLVRRSGWVDVEAASVIMVGDDARDADTLYFDVQPGGVMYFEVDWSD